MFATGPRAVGFTIVWPEGVIFSSMMTYHVQFLLLVLAGWVNRQQQDVIDYLQEENRVLRAGLRGKRLRLSDDDRRRLAVKAQALGREALAQIAYVATPATLLARRIRDASSARRRSCACGGCPPDTRLSCRRLSRRSQRREPSRERVGSGDACAFYLFIRAHRTGLVSSLPASCLHDFVVCSRSHRSPQGSARASSRESRSSRV